ncbi:MAG: hypothetical protein II879_02205 [Clostridia bacterium]|nr:hypothetical protein [Clostridia bacterium]
MKCGKLTAKLRDAVPVCFLVNGREVKRFKNIEIPDEVKELDYADFRFDVPENGGAITFKIMFEEGILPEVWPEARTRQHRAAKTEPAIEEPPVQEQPAEPQHVAEEPVNEIMVASYHVTGDRRKALVMDIAAWLETDAVYQKAPTYAYKIGEYTVDREGTLEGPMSNDLFEFLASKGYEAGI